MAGTKNWRDQTNLWWERIPQQGCGRGKGPLAHIFLDKPLTLLSHTEWKAFSEMQHALTLSCVLLYWGQSSAWRPLQPKSSSKIKDHAAGALMFSINSEHLVSRLSKHPGLIPPTSSFVNLYATSWQNCAQHSSRHITWTISVTNCGVMHLCLNWSISVVTVIVSAIASMNVNLCL